MSTAYSSAFQSVWTPSPRYTFPVQGEAGNKAAGTWDLPHPTALSTQTHSPLSGASRPSELPKINEDDVLNASSSDLEITSHAQFLRTIVEPDVSKLQVAEVRNEVSPCTTSFSAGRQRLLVRLDFYGLVERVVKGDGNCQFRALSDQLYGSPSFYKELRTVATQQLHKHRRKYQDFISEDINQYIDKMKEPGTWGDHITLQAIADYFGVKIYVVTSFLEKSVISVKPEKLLSDRVLWLSFWAEVHYNSLYPESEPPQQVPREKVLGSKRIARYLQQEWSYH